MASGRCNGDAQSCLGRLSTKVAKRVDIYLLYTRQTSYRTGRRRIAEFDSVLLAPRAQRCAPFGLLELVPLLEHASIGEEDLQAAVRALAPEERRDFLGICGQSLLNESLDESNAEIQFVLTRNGQVPDCQRGQRR